MKKVYYIGDVVEMKKGHPCGSNEWEVIRLGADIKIKCCGCGRIVMLPRNKFEKSVKKIIKQNSPDEKETQ
ncbi:MULTISPECIES: DUF951 domain-containing protein [Clostridium]|uniref:DUF951 domain-containing protein n=4 Tax=Clostridium TaxID=1485 RepID=D8GJX9_CLOLD|nr:MULTISPECIES: DUF951 domain-containing protein [Clostridium]ADK17281.1 conserved hypothetical protein [Clostridium ljungdahlii DSM 13528]AGY76321.1 DUF951 domain-containing protein [Clostridium autoethanogenum DSM 10061]ALU36483.1 hypothetical protein CLAU_2054 [Clostridium autoethanogenum DSM 10061]OAA84148.1 hypothetical protein WX45_01893 [Clostridium ljungdahlii DSM 13528]OAA93148.1 hypothetical protein WX73_00475 [Clostridium coskatii]